MKTRYQLNNIQKYKYKSGIKFFKQITLINSKNYMGYLYMGNCYYHMKEFKEADKCYNLLEDLV